MRSTDGPWKNINNPGNSHNNHEFKADTTQCSPVTNTKVCHFPFQLSRSVVSTKSKCKAKGTKKKKKDNDKNHLAYRSVVDFTSSRFHKPHVSWRAVDRNSRTFTHSKIPMGPKKNAKISMSPVGRERRFVLATSADNFNYLGRKVSEKHHSWITEDYETVKTQTTKKIGVIQRERKVFFTCWKNTGYLLSNSPCLTATLPKI